MQGYAQEICRTRFFVGLRIEVDAPAILAAIRRWGSSDQDRPALLVMTGLEVNPQWRRFFFK